MPVAGQRETADHAPALGYYRHPHTPGLIIDECDDGIVITYPAPPLWPSVVWTTILALCFCVLSLILPMLLLHHEASFEWWKYTGIVAAVWYILLRILIARIKTIRRRLSGQNERKLDLTSRHLLQQDEPGYEQLLVTSIRVIPGRLLPSLYRESKLVLETEEGEFELQWLRNRPVTELKAIADQLRQALHLPAEASQRP